MTIQTPLRPWLLFVATLAWIWAASIFTPWAADDVARLWLHDTLFYCRYLLIFWAGAELLYLAFRWNQPKTRRAVLPLALTLVAALAAWIYEHSGAALKLRVAASAAKLERVAAKGHDDDPVRAGQFLIDSVRSPCVGQTWLWLGRPNGGGTGSNLALVRTSTAHPHTPNVPPFRFWRVSEGWWMAYQHADGYQRIREWPAADRCQPGREVGHHREGMRFREDGRRALKLAH